MPDSGHLKPETLGSVSLGEQSLADLIDRIQADKALTPTKRSQWTCSLRRVAAFLERHPEQLPARMGGLRQGLAHLHHANLGVSRKSLQNHLANLKAALAYARGHARPGRGAPLDPGWNRLMASVEETSLKRALSSLARFCSIEKVRPEAVNDAVIEAFISWRQEVSFLRKPNSLHKQVASAWNRLAALQDRLQTVTVPDFRPKARSLTWDRFPERFQRDVEDYLYWRGGETLDEDGPARPVASTTLDVDLRRLKLLASAAVRAGIDPRALTKLADLVAPEVARSALEQYIRENNGRRTAFIADLAGLAFSVGRNWCRLPELELDRLRGFRRKLDRSRRKGLTDKNMAVVRQVLDGCTWDRVRNLPERLMDQALAKPTALHKAAVRAQLAVAIQILIVAPMRVGNLCALSLDDNLVRPAGPDGPLHVVIADHDVKNRVALEYPLPASVTRLVDLYRTRFRHRLKGSNGPWLFPGENGEHKRARTLSEQISDVIWRETGIRMTVHQFRHAAAAIILKHDPGNYELVRRVLSHENITTSVNAYIGLESLEAARHFSRIALGRDDEEDDR